jgi:hypothetical protein
MKTLLTINNADNQLVAYLNDGLVYNESHENNPPLNDVVDLSDKLIPGTNSLSILGVNWSGPATYKGSVSLDGMITPWEYEGNSPPIGIIWRKVFVITNPVGATVTIKFSGLVPGQSTNSYTESGYNLSGDSIFAGWNDGMIGAFPSDGNTVFTFKKVDGASFDMISVMLMNLNDTVGSQTIDFTGNLTAGGTVTHSIITSADQNQYSTFTFPASFTKLASLVWNPPLVIMTNLNVAPSAGIR